MNTPYELHDPNMCKALLQKLDQRLQDYGQDIRFMEVCGTHTVSIFQSGLRSLLPKGLTHLSGPGCPVCVTHDAEVATFLTFAAQKDIIVATFGDLMRVPAPNGESLKHAVADGAHVQVIYSPLDAVELAKNNPQKQIVFLGVGFETTAPAVAASILSAKKQNIHNFSVFSCHKLVPPALKALLSNEESTIDAFLLPGHVALILGLKPFMFLAQKYNSPAIVAGFEPAEIIHALYMIVEQKISGKISVENAYTRAVANEGNLAAQNIMAQVFATHDTKWRGLGLIPQSGLTIREEFAEFDALLLHNIKLEDTIPLKGCRCGDVLSGKISPKECPLFGTVCTPHNPTGPCMVSTEGSCAAWYQYDGVDFD